AAVAREVRLTLSLLRLELRPPCGPGLALLAQVIERGLRLTDRFLACLQLTGETVPLRLSAAHLARDACDLIAHCLELRPGLAGVARRWHASGMPMGGARRHGGEHIQHAGGDQARDAEASHMSAIMRALFTAGATFGCLPHGPSASIHASALLARRRDDR